MSSSAAWAQDPPPATPAAVSDGGEQLLLDATLNGTPTAQMLTVIRHPDGRFIAHASELRQLRLRIDPALVHDDAVSLAAIPGLAFSYDEADQAITLSAPDGLLQPYDVGVGYDRQPVDVDKIRPTPGAILNYGLYATHGSGQTALSGNAELIGMTPVGIVSSNALFDTRHSYGNQSIVRLDTSWRFIDAHAIRSYTIGDFASNALAWTSSVRLAGFQISSAFEQRSDIVATALPQFAGSAALPSTLDLYVNQQKIFSGEIPSGPFDVKSLPYVSGGNVELVTTDATGRQVTVNQAYYYVPGQLRKGLFEYSLDVGAPRLDYATKSFAYDDTVFGSASARYGATRTTTIEAHAETSSGGLATVGVGIVQSIAGSGAITASIAGSRYQSKTGAKFAVQAEAYLAGIRFYAGTERTVDAYFDLARVSAMRDAKRYEGTDSVAANLLDSTAQAKAIDRAGLSFTPWFDRTSVSLSYNGIKSAGLDQRLANLSLSRGIGDRLSVYTNGYVDVHRTGNYGVFGTINIRIGRSTSVATGVEHDGGHSATTVQAERLTGQRQGDVGWGVTDREVQGDDDQRTAYVSYRAAQALVRAHVEQDGKDWRTGLDVEGSLVAAGGGVFTANQIGDGFVIVKDAGPGAEVIQGGVRMGRTNSAGRALLPNVQPYYNQQVFIDPATLPDGWEPATTEQLAVTGYRQGTVVDFGAKRVFGAVVVVHDAHGKEIAPGYVAQLIGGESAVIGYGGEVYLRGLAASNRISVDLGLGGICTASFSYDVKGPAQPRIGPVTCQ